MNKTLCEVRPTDAHPYSCSFRWKNKYEYANTKKGGEKRSECEEEKRGGERREEEGEPDEKKGKKGRKWGRGTPKGKGRRRGEGLEVNWAPIGRMAEEGFEAGGDDKVRV